MCVAYPLKVIELNNKTAIGEMGGVKISFATDFCPNIKAGDFVLVHAGYAIEILDEKEANENIQLFNELKEIMND